MRHGRHSLLIVAMALLIPLLVACNLDTGTGSPLPTATLASPSNDLTPQVGVQATGTETGATPGASDSANDLQIDPNTGLVASGRQLLGLPAPDFTLPGLDGNTYSLSSQRGKPVVLEFLATWCPHCQDEAPMMNQLDAAYKSRGVQMFGINATPLGHDHSSPATIADLQWFHDTYSVTFPLLFDKELKSANDYGVYFYPSVFIVDQKGIVSFQPPSDQLPSYDLLSGELEKLLAKTK